MVKPSALRFWQVALQSGLMDASGLQACWNALPPEKRTPDAIDRRMARQAVQSGRLTLWQAQQLVAGRSTGYKIDRYTLLDLLGQGGMGRVYLARDTRLNRLVAVKILSPERVNNPRAILRFHREAMVGAQLQHENLVRIYDEGESNGRCYLVMEYIEGKTIGAMISEGGRIPSGVAARLARQVALGLEHAQRKGLIHRDVNPYNILVTHEGVAKLTDMGLAIDLADQERVTRDGATVGTFDYVSPEQARHSHHVDTRSDIYSLGCSLYHMLSGQVPFPSASLPQKLLGHQAVDPDPLDRVVPGVPQGLSAVVAKMMRKSPDDRYPNPLDLAQALEAFADDGPAAAGDITPNLQGPLGAAPTGVVASRSTSSGIKAAAAAREAGATAREAPPVPAGHPTEPFPIPFVEVTAATPPALTGPQPMPRPGPLPVTAAPPERPPPAPAPKLKPVAAAVNLAVDLGPEPSLSEGLTSSRGRAKPGAVGSSSGTGARDVGGAAARPGVSNEWLVPVAVALAIALVLALGAGFAAYRAAVGGGETPRKPPGAKATPTDDSRRRAPQRATLKGQEVEVVGADETTSVEPDLATAVRTAIGSGGYILLRNTTPLRVNAETIVASGGALTIKAGEGARPILDVEIRKDKPFLRTRAKSALKIVGVTIVAHYNDPGPDPPALIEAGGSVTLDRCAFRVEGPERGPVTGARALVMEGGDLAASGCSFENFDRALDLAAFSGSITTISQCLFVHNGNPTQPAAGTGLAAGWAVRMRGMPGGAPKVGRKLVMEQCTCLGRGFLDFGGFSAETGPAFVDLRRCAVLADALVSWESAAPKGTPPTVPGRDVLSWQGEGDQYEVRGKSWLLLAPEGGPTEPMPGGPTDVNGWNQSFGTERDPVFPPLRFAIDPAALADRPSPPDFAVIGEDASRHVGADPALVGPGARAARKL